MPATYEPIATTTLGSAASSITFSSIPATYTDLRIVIVRKSGTSDQCVMTYNNDTATNYSLTVLYGSGSSAASFRSTSTANIPLHIFGSTTTIPALNTIDIFSYAGSTNKTCLCSNNEDQNGGGGVGSIVGLWRSSAAINRIDFTASGGNFAAGTTATLYGIKAA